MLGGDWLLSTHRRFWALLSRVFGIGWAVFLPAPLLAGDLVLYDTEAQKVVRQSLEQVLQAHPLPPNRPLQGTFLGKVPGASLHLVQIRLREKPHIHRTHDLIVILQQGRGRIHLGQEAVSVRAGDVVVIPRGVVHYYEHEGTGTSVGIGIFVPVFQGKDRVPAPPAPPPLPRTP